jgi:hypothetical protein
VDTGIFHMEPYLVLSASWLVALAVALLPVSVVLGAQLTAKSLILLPDGLSSPGHSFALRLRCGGLGARGGGDVGIQICATVANSTRANLNRLREAGNILAPPPESRTGHAEQGGGLNVSQEGGAP